MEMKYGKTWDLGALQTSTVWWVAVGNAWQGDRRVYGVYEGFGELLLASLQYNSTTKRQVLCCWGFHRENCNKERIRIEEWENRAELLENAAGKRLEFISRVSETPKATSPPNSIITWDMALKLHNCRENQSGKRRL